MKKFLKMCLCAIVFCLSFSLCGCSLFNNSTSSQNDSDNSSNSVTRSSSSAFSDLDSTTAVTEVSNFTCTNNSTNETVTIYDSTDANNSYTGTTIIISDNIITLTNFVECYDEDDTEKTQLVQEFTITGEFYGQIYINDTTESYAVTLNLEGVNLNYDQDSPIYIKKADSVDISAKKDTVNYIFDTREQIESEEDDTSSLGKGAIYAKCDLTIKGKGELIISADYNNGIHTTKDLTIKNLTLSIMAYNNGLKGNDSLTIESGTITVVSTAGDGLKTTDSDISSKNKQRGTITIASGTIEIYADFDGIDASYNVEISGGDITIYTYTYSQYSDTTLNSVGSSSSSSSSSSSRAMGNMNMGGIMGGPGGNTNEGGDSEGNSNSTLYSTKGIKADNEISISAATIEIHSYDDCIHANSDVALENGTEDNINYGTGKVTITSGTLTLESKDDAIHADSTLQIDGGTINITTAYEGIEGNIINITEDNEYGASTSITIYATDDGVNACDGDSTTPSITIKAGYLDVTVSSGDTDGIDSNGTYTQTGGFVVTRCPSTSADTSSGLDSSSTITISGGTFICAGAFSQKLTTTLKNKSWSSTTFSSGTYTLTNTSSNTEIFSFELSSSYKGLYIYSSDFTSGNSYSLSSTSISTLSFTIS